MHDNLLQLGQLARRYGLIALMLFVLAGVQLVQASPLHDHTQHSVDCALCHVPLADAPTSPQGILPEFTMAVAAQATHANVFRSTHSPSPYQGRAPPAVLP